MQEIHIFDHALERETEESVREALLHSLKGESSLVKKVVDIFTCDFLNSPLHTGSLDIADIKYIFEGSIIDVIEVTTEDLPADMYEPWTNHHGVVQRMHEHAKDQDIRIMTVMRGFNDLFAIDVGGSDFLRSFEEKRRICGEPYDFLPYILCSSAPRSITICIAAVPGTKKMM